MRTVIFDIDGTLADITHRLHHIHKDPKDWGAFFGSVLEDKPVPSIVNLLTELDYTDPILITGRSEDIRRDTQGWLAYYNIGYYKLYMRKSGDRRPDYEVKPELLAEAGLLPEDVWFVVEDRDQVVKMWRDLGITCLQCREGDY